MRCEEYKYLAHIPTSGTMKQGLYHFNLFFFLGNISENVLKTCFFHILKQCFNLTDQLGGCNIYCILLVIYERLKESLNYIFTGLHTFIMYIFILSSTSF